MTWIRIVLDFEFNPKFRLYLNDWSPRASPLRSVIAPRNTFPLLSSDQNDLVILQDVADVTKARTWLASDEMKAAMEKGGVVGSPNIRFAA
jgi:hypothetical protein